MNSCLCSVWKTLQCSRFFCDDETQHVNLRSCSMSYHHSKQATAYHKLFLILSHFNNNEIACGSSRLWEVKFIISNTIQFTYSACLPPNQPALNLLLQISNSIPDKLTIIVYSHYYIIVLSNKHNSKAHLRLFLQYFWADNATGHWKLNP